MRSRGSGSQRALSDEKELQRPEQQTAGPWEAVLRDKRFHKLYGIVSHYLYGKWINLVSWVETMRLLVNEAIRLLSQ